KDDLHQRLNRASEITLSVKGRKSGRDIPRPVWFVHEGNTLYLLPVQGSDTNWYKNLLVDSTLKISTNGTEIPARGKAITDSNRVDDILRKFKSKYGEGEVKKYYTKFDVAHSDRPSHELTQAKLIYSIMHLERAKNF
ncbi:MAG: nitroreductase/quinone reductase family protein, partial [Nitrososphaera sp.]